MLSLPNVRAVSICSSRDIYLRMTPATDLAIVLEAYDGRALPQSDVIELALFDAQARHVARRRGFPVLYEDLMWHNKRPRFVPAASETGQITESGCGDPSLPGRNQWMTAWNVSERPRELVSCVER